MAKFIGEYSAKLDDKGRVVFPSALKSQFLESFPKGSSEVDMRFVVKKDLWEDCLEMYSFAEWERQSEGVKSGLNFFKKDHASFWREYTRNRAIVQPETKLGRIGIPKTLLESIGAGKELVFCGCDHKIEIWDAKKFEESGLTREKFLSLAESLSD